jgi:hypothetical protein
MEQMQTRDESHSFSSAQRKARVAPNPEVFRAMHAAGSEMTELRLNIGV